MEFISVNEFLEQDKKIQEVFLKWWKPSDGDIYWWKEDKHIDCCYNWKFIDNLDVDNLKGREIIPMLTEGQLRKFVEDKTEFPILKIELINGQYDIYTQYKAIDNHSDIYVYDELGEDLLQAYWKVAIKIAKES